MKEKTKFRYKLNRITKVLESYSIDKFDMLTEYELAGVRLRYGIMMQAILDIHFGTLKQQKSASVYFTSPLYIEHCREVGIDSSLMDKIIESTDEYLDEIGEYSAQEEEYDIYL